MTNQELILDMIKAQGKTDALNLRGRAVNMDGTAIIAEERKIPSFDSAKDYSDWPINSPVRDEGQVWLLLQPNNAAHYEGRPSTLRALWGLAHTKDPAKAKPYVAPFGTSGLYMMDECCLWTDGKVYKSIIENNAYDPEAYADGWTEVVLK